VAILIPPSFSDLLGRLPDGRWVFCKVKKDGGRFRAGQKDFLEARRVEGHIAFHARSVAEALEKFEQQTRPEATTGLLLSVPRERLERVMVYENQAVVAW